MKMPALMLTVMAAALLMAPASAQDRESPLRKEQIQESVKKVKDLQKERLATLKELVAALDNSFKNGRVEYQDVLEGRRLLFKAELDAADKDLDRIRLYKRMVDVWKQSEQLAQTRVNAGRGTTGAVLRFKALRLEAEIDLEQALAKKPAVEHRKIGITTPKAKDVVITQKYVCQIHARRHIKVRALQKGYIENIPIKEGQAVKKGDLMFTIVPILYKAKWEAELAESRIAELGLNNTKRLFEQKVISSQELALLQAKVAKAQAKVKLAEAEFNFTRVRAPFDGLIDRLREQQGSLITEGDIVTTLSDNSSMWVYFDVPPVHYLDYMAGPGGDKEGKIELMLAKGRKFKQAGKIGAIEAQFNDNGSIPFRADFPNPDGLLRHGMTGNVLLQRTLKNAIIIPQRATFAIRDKRYVYVVDKDDVAHRREIVVQNELDDISVINNGVGVGDRIIFEGTRQVRDGEKVEYEFCPPDQIPGQPGT